MQHPKVMQFYVVNSRSNTNGLEWRSLDRRRVSLSPDIRTSAVENYLHTGSNGTYIWVFS